MKLNSKCKYCDHSAVITGRDGLGAELGCLYILDENEPRGCPAGDNCDKFKNSRKRRGKTFKMGKALVE